MLKKCSLFLLCLCLFFSVMCLSACSNDGMTKTDYAEALKSASDKCKETIASEIETSFTLLAVDQEDFQVVERTDVVMACIWFMDFLKNSLENDNYTLSNDFFECYVNETSDEYNIRFSMDYNQETNNVKAVCFATEKDSSSAPYFEFDVVYDFETSTLTSFEMRCYLFTFDFDREEVYFFRYADGALEEAPYGTSSQAEVADAIERAYEEHKNKEWGSTLPDFSEEYIRANPYPGGNA